MEKDKWVAGFLNIVPGGGYLYLGVRKPFAILLLSIWPIAVLSGMVWPEWLETSETTTPELMPPDIMVFGVILFAFMYDAYLEAEKLIGKKTEKPVKATES